MSSPDGRDDLLAAIRRRLLARAALFDDPRAYAAGVRDALAALAGSEPGLDASPTERPVRTHASLPPEALS